MSRTHVGKLFAIMRVVITYQKEAMRRARCSCYFSSPWRLGTVVIGQLMPGAILASPPVETIS